MPHLTHGLRYALLALLLTTGLAACDSGSASSQGEGRFLFAPDQDRFALGQDIEATLTNRTDETVYVFVRGCLATGLERRAQSGWEEVSIPIGCVAIVRPPVAVAPGDEYRAGIAAQWLAEADLAPGRYRLTLAIGETEKERESADLVTSEPFSVAEAGE